MIKKAIQTDISGDVALDRHAVGYVRISTREQNEETQLHPLLARGVPREQIFIDTTTSGITHAGDRPGFRAVLEFVRTSEITTLYVFEISRIGRSFLETLGVVRRLEEECGVIVWSLSPKESWTQTTDHSIRNLIRLFFRGWVNANGRISVSAQRQGLHGREAKASISEGHFGRLIGARWMSTGQRVYHGRGSRGSMDISYNTLLAAKARRSAREST